MSTASAFRSVANALLCALALSCSLSVDVDRKQCATDFDCRKQGAEFADNVCVDTWCVPEPKWSCLGAPVGLSGDRGPFLITFHIQDIRKQQPMAGVQARLCRKSDVNCDTPQAGAVTSDEHGVVRFAVEPEDPAQGFTGFVLFTRDDLMPGLYFLNRPIDRPIDVPGVQLLSLAEVDVLTQQVGATRDPTRGVVLLSTFDCQDEPAAGVTLVTDDADELSAPFYSKDGLPVASATATDESGYAGLVNVPPGTITVTGRLEVERRLLSTISLRVKAGAITYSRMVPRER